MTIKFFTYLLSVFILFFNSFLFIIYNFWFLLKLIIIIIIKTYIIYRLIILNLFLITNQYLFKWIIMDHLNYHIITFRIHLLIIHCLYQNHNIIIVVFFILQNDYYTLILFIINSILLLIKYSFESDIYSYYILLS